MIPMVWYAPGSPKAFPRNTWDKNPFKMCFNHGSFLYHFKQFILSKWFHLWFFHWNTCKIVLPYLRVQKQWDWIVLSLIEQVRYRPGVAELVLGFCVRNVYFILSVSLAPTCQPSFNWQSCLTSITSLGQGYYCIRLSVCVCVCLCNLG